MSSFSPAVVAMLVGSVAAQVIGLLAMPHSRGLTSPLPTAVMFLFFLAGIGLMARLVSTGINLSTLLPLVASAIPLSSILIGITFMGESASPPKIALLIAACGLVLVAGYLR